jgi:hypothetical protein
MDIITDVDCVAADFVGKVMSMVGRPAARNEAKIWDWFDGYTEEQAIIIRDAMTTREFWQNLPLIKGVKEGIEYLRNQGHRIVWCTAPYKFCPVWVDARYKWLETHFGRSALEEPIVFTKYKYLVDGLALIDDRADWVDKWQAAHPKGIGFVFKTELNEGLDRERVDWNDIMNMGFFKSKQ